AGTLTAQAGNDLILDHATLSAGQNLGLAAGHDLTATASTLTAGGDAQLLAGHDLTLNADRHTVDQGASDHLAVQTIHDVTTVHTGGSAVLAAGHDLTSQGAVLQAGQTLAGSAGHDVMLDAVTDTQVTQGYGRDGHTDITTLDTDQALRGTLWSGTNGVAISAGHDLTALAGTIASSQGNVALAAGHDVSLIAGQETHTQQHDTHSRTGNLLNHSQRSTHDVIGDTDAVGTQISGHTVSVAAGHDLTAQAAYLNANNTLTLAAGHDVTLADAHDLHSEEHDTAASRFSFFSTSSKRFGSVDPEGRSNQSSTQINQSTSVGSVLSGDSVTVAAGHDLSATHAQVVGTNDVALAAGNHLTLDAGQNTDDVSQAQSTRHTGLMNNGGLSVLIGNRSTKDGYSEHDVSYTGSIVGSLNGSVTLSAGNDVHITGSDVLSQTGTAIVGNNVTIDAAVGTSDIHQSHKVSQGGINVGIGGAAADAVNGALYSVQRGSQVQDGRLSALYAAQAGYQASDAVGMAQKGGLQEATQTNNPSGINLQVGLGGSSAGNTTTTHDDIAYGSHITSQGNVTLAATGGDLNLIGSQVSGQDVALAAANHLNLQSQAENHSLQNTDHNVSGGVGLQIGSDGIGIYAQASGGEGKAHGNGITHADTTVNANGTLTLISGNDTTLKGAQLIGHQVIGAIGHNLLIQSEQDTDDYASQQWQAGGKVVIGYGSGGSLSYNQSKVDSHYQSVNEVSGIQAGDGGFQLAVGGNTHLVGGVIASTADPGNNLLDTGSLTYENIHNEANYSASSVGISGGYGAGGSTVGNALSGIGTALSLTTPQHGKSSSDTNAGIAQGT
ncbi:hemagglutinin repeat-containing protein, partial [Dyella jejuensis]